MCIKKGIKTAFSESPKALLFDQLILKVLPGDVIVIQNVGFDTWLFYMGQTKVIYFNEMGVRIINLSNAIGASVAATVFRCCDDWQCQCRLDSILRAKEALDGENDIFLPGSYKLLYNNDESFCYHCVHGEAYTKRGQMAINFCIIPAILTGGGATTVFCFGFTLWLLGASLSPETGISSILIATGIGAWIVLLLSLVPMAIMHYKCYAQLKCYCSTKKRRSII